MTAANNPVTNRPAESGGAATAIGALIARAFGVKDPDTLTYLIIAVGFVPAAITWTVSVVRRRNGQPGS